MRMQLGEPKASPPTVATSAVLKKVHGQVLAALDGVSRVGLSKQC